MTTNDGGWKALHYAENHRRVLDVCTVISIIDPMFPTLEALQIRVKDSHCAHALPLPLGLSFCASPPTPTGGEHHPRSAALDL